MNAAEKPNEWRRIAQMDLDTAHYIFDNMHPKPLEIVCFLAQQSAEKLLKGFLVSQEIDPPKTHDLRALRILCMERKQEFVNISNECSLLTLYGVQPRYPNEIEITEEDTRRALRDIDSIMAFFKGCIFM